MGGVGWVQGGSWVRGSGLALGWPKVGLKAVSQRGGNVETLNQKGEV